MSTFTNTTKNAATFGNTSKSNVATWDDSAVDWDSPLFAWDGGQALTPQTKNAVAIFTNVTKN